MAEALAAAGARVAIVGRNAERGARACAGDRSGRRPGACSSRADALDRDSLAQARDAIAQKLGPASVLVNAAGGNRPDATLPPGADFCRLPLAAWQSVFDLNLVGGVLLPAQVFGETMLAAGQGSIDQHCLDGRHDSAVARGGLFGGQGGGDQPDAIFGPRVGRAACA